MIVEFFNQSQLDHYIRPLLQKKLEAALADSDFKTASETLAAFIDTWPIGGSIDIAWNRWIHGWDELALTTLNRASEIMSLLEIESPDLPLPDNLPPYERIDGIELESRREELCEKAIQNQIVAVLFNSPVPNTPNAQLALGELRMEASAQLATERFGLAGLVAPYAPIWERAFGAAPPGKMGEKLRKMCDLAVLPGTPKRLAKGETTPVAWLLWNGPAKPLPIANVAAELMRKAHLGCEKAIEEMGLSPDRGREIISELVLLGALDRIN